MTKYFSERIDDLEIKINELLTEENNFLTACEKIIKIVVKDISELKKNVLEKGFQNEQEEICFFKYIKPRFVAKLIYYNSIYKIETKKPTGTKAVRKYLNKELKKLKRYFDNNLDFYKYYRTNSTFIDDKLFIRGKYDIKLNLDTVYFDTDHRFSTSHDYKAAKIIANDLLQIYIEDLLNNNIQQISSDNFTLNWAESKTALTELIYALYAQGAFGNADIIAIAKTFENTFNISLGDFYHTFMELKSRKINRTKFLDSLREALIKKIDEQDEK